MTSIRERHRVWVTNRLAAMVAPKVKDELDDELAAAPVASPTPGTPGKSAYEVWLDAGNSGDLTAFFASLKGSPGNPGVGTTGKSAYQTWLDNGHSGTEAQFLASLKGADGAGGALAPATDGTTFSMVVDANGRLQAIPAYGTGSWVFANTLADSFARTDRTLSTDNGWSVTDGTWRIQSGVAQSSTTSVASNLHRPLTLDQSVQATVKAFPGSGDLGVLLRFVDTNNWLYASPRTSGDVVITQRLAGTYTDLEALKVPVAVNQVFRAGIVGQLLCVENLTTGKAGSMRIIGGPQGTKGGLRAYEVGGPVMGLDDVVCLYK